MNDAPPPEAEIPATTLANKPSRGKALLRLAFGALGAAFIFITLRDLVRKWDPASVTLHFGWIALAVPLVVVACSFSSAAWLRLNEAASGQKLPRLIALDVYWSSQLARYMPGKVGLPAVRFASAERLGLRKSFLGVSLLIETLAWIAIGGVISSAVLLLHPRVWHSLEPSVRWLGVLLFVGSLFGVVMLGALDRRHVPEFVRKRLAFEGHGPFVPVSTILLYGAHWLSWIFHGAILATALGAGVEGSLLVGAVLALGIVLGFVSLLAPAGAGVREAVIAVGAAPFVGATGAVAVGLLSRGISLLVEIGMWFVFRVLVRRSGARGVS